MNETMTKEQWDKTYENVSYVIDNYTSKKSAKAAVMAFIEKWFATGWYKGYDAGYYDHQTKRHGLRCSVCDRPLSNYEIATDQLLHTCKEIE